MTNIFLIPSLLIYINIYLAAENEKFNYNVKTFFPNGESFLNRSNARIRAMKYEIIMIQFELRNVGFKNLILTTIEERRITRSDHENKPLIRLHYK